MDPGLGGSYSIVNCWFLDTIRNKKCRCSKSHPVLKFTQSANIFWCIDANWAKSRHVCHVFKKHHHVATFTTKNAKSHRPFTYSRWQNKIRKITKKGCCHSGHLIGRVLPHSLDLSLWLLLLLRLQERWLEQKLQDKYLRLSQMDELMRREIHGKSHCLLTYLRASTGLANDSIVLTKMWCEKNVYVYSH